MMENDAIDLPDYKGIPNNNNTTIFVPDGCPELTQQEFKSFHNLIIKNLFSIAIVIGVELLYDLL